MALFTAENAADYGKRGAIARWTPKPVIEPPSAIEQADADKDKALARTRSQIDRVDAALDACDDAREWDALTRAKERLFKQWVHLANIPGPGQRKPAPERSKPNRPGSPLAEE